MKTINSLKTAVLVYALTYIGAYMTNGILGFEIIPSWIVALLSINAGVLGELYKIYRLKNPTLLNEKYKGLQKKLENSQIEAGHVEEIVNRNNFLESEFENAKAALEQQQAELDRVEAAYQKIEAKLEKSEAEKSELKNTISDLEAKLEKSEAETKRWASDYSSVREAFLKSNEIIKTNKELNDRESQNFQANLAEAEQTISEIHKFLSEFIAKFGYGIFTRDWEKFKKWWSVNIPEYNINRLNAMTTDKSRSEMTLTAEACEIFERHFFDESEVVSE